MDDIDAALNELRTTTPKQPKQLDLYEADEIDSALNELRGVQTPEVQRPVGAVPVPARKPNAKSVELDQLHLNFDKAAEMPIAERAKRESWAKTLGVPVQLLPEDAEAQVMKRKANLDSLTTDFPEITRYLNKGDNAAMGGRNIENLTAIRKAMYRVAVDPVIDVAKGVASIPEAVVGIADLFSKGKAGKKVEDAGISFKDFQGKLSSLYSPEFKANLAEEQKTEGFLETLGLVAERPTLATSAIAQSIPLMMSGGAVSQVIRKQFPKVSALLAGAAGEATVIAGSQAEKVRQQTESGELSWEQVGIVAGSSIAAGGVGVLGAKISQRLGFGDIDTALASGKLSDALGKAAVPKSLATKILAGTAGEGGEEMTQTAIETIAENVALGKVWDDGLEKAMAMGLVTGSAMGGGVQTLAAVAGAEPEAPNAADKELDVKAADAIKTLSKAVNASEARKTLGDLVKTATDDPMRKDAPEAFKDFVRTMADEDDAITDVYIKADLLEETLKQADINLGEAMPTLASDLKLAKATNSDVRISIEDFATHIVGAGVAEQLLDHTRVEPEGMTFNESEKFYQEQLNEFAKQAEEIVTRNQPILSRGEFIDQGLTGTYEDYLKTHSNRVDAFAKDAQEVHNKLLAGMNASKRFNRTVNEVYAIPFREFYTVNAAREGIMPSELYARLPLNFAKMQIEGLEGYQQFAGQKSATADTSKLAQAKALKAEGTNTETIRRKTGWFVGDDGKWRYEINDSDAKLKVEGGVTFNEVMESTRAKTGNAAVTVSDLLNHPALFAAYPGLADVNVGNIAQGRGVMSFTKEGINIAVNGSLTPKQALSTMLHEIQHFIQSVENFGRGGSVTEIANNITRYAPPEMFDAAEADPDFPKDGTDDEQDTFVLDYITNELGSPMDIYRRLAGEVEARNVQARQDLTPELREMMAPFMTSDVPSRDVIVMFNGQKVRGILPEGPRYEDATPTLDIVGRNQASIKPTPATAEDFTKEGASEILAKGDWVILTAANPNSVTQSDAENDAANAKLVAELSEKGLEFETVYGMYSEEGVEAVSYLVYGVNTKDAHELGNKYGQESVLTREGLVYQDGKVAPARRVMQFDDTAQAAKTGYTRVPRTDLVFTFDIDFNARAQQGALTLIGAHYSGEKRTALEGQYYGAGMAGEEKFRVAESNDPRIKTRVDFYADIGNGIKPEAGFGAVLHKVMLHNIYDGRKNPLRLSFPSDWLGANVFEQQVLDAGFDGYYTERSGQGRVVMLGTAAEKIDITGEFDEQRNEGVLQESAGQDTGTREADGSLRGLPRQVGSFSASHYQKAEEVTRKYMESAGLPYNPPSNYVKVDEDRARRIAQAFDAMEHNPQDPEVKAAYEALAVETKAQYQAVMDAGLVVEFIDFEKMGDPYAGNPRAMTDDVRNNNHMYVFSTRDGFGSSEFDPTDNPLLAETEFEISGQKALVNDLFRVVHDYFGHVKEGVGFRAAGEENAWRAHMSMFSPLAGRALTTETRGQNSWVNFGPFAEHNRTASGADTHYADQKIGLLPEWVSTEGREDIGNFPGDRVSTRVPSELAGRPNPHLTGGLDVNLDALYESPTLTRKLASVMNKYVGVKPSRSKDPKKVLENFIEQATENLLWLHDQVPENIRERSKLWYDGGRVIVDRLADKYKGKYSTQQMAAALAALSPQTPWDINASISERMVDVYTEQQDTGWTPEMESVMSGWLADGKDPEWAVVRGFSLRELKDNRLKALWIRVYDEAHNPRSYRAPTPEGGYTGIVKNKSGTEAKVAWGCLDNMAKVVAILQDSSMSNISFNLGVNHKVRSFYNNLIDPSDPNAVTIDTHAVAAALLKPLSGSSLEVVDAFGKAGKDTPRGLQGSYVVYAEAYRRAALQRGIKARELQSITWEASRGLFNSRFKAQYTSDPTARAEFDNVLKALTKGEIDHAEARQRITTISGGIQDPAWTVSDTGLHESGAASSYTGEVLGAGGVAGAARSRARSGATGAVPTVGSAGAAGVLNQSAFYSALEREIGGLYKLAGKDGMIQAEQAKAWVNSRQKDGKFKKEEVEAVGLMEWLSVQEGKVPVADIENFVKQNGVVIDETFLEGEGEQQFTEEEVSELAYENFTDSYEAPQFVFDEPLGELAGDMMFSTNHDNWASLIGVEGEEEVNAWLEKEEVESSSDLYRLLRRRYDLEEIFGEDRYYEILNEAEEAAWEDAREYFEDRARADLTDQYGLQEGGAVYWDYVLPGGENYQELLLKLPNAPDTFEAPHFDGHENIIAHTRTTERIRKVETEEQAAYKKAYDEWQAGNSTPEILELLGAKRESAANLERLAKGELITLERQEQEPELKAEVERNIELSAKVKALQVERRAVEPKMPVEGAGSTERVLFVEEIQSDWAQQGRDKGFARTFTAEEEAEIDVLNARIDEINDELRGLDRESPTYADEYTEIAGQKTPLIVRRAEIERAVKGGVPRAPFVMDTKAWTALVVKRLMRYAAENGFDRIAWAHGAQQSARYDLSKRIKSVFAQRTPDGYFVDARTPQGQTVVGQTYKAEELPGVFGKDLAEKIVAQGEGIQEYAGDGLTIGGEGMKAFYDKIVPSVFNDVSKKLGGGKVEVVDMGVRGEFENDRVGMQQSVAITPEMREKIMSGQPLFQKARASFNPQTLTIALTQGSDLSSVVHEGGHFYLEALQNLASQPNASQQVKDDFKKTLEWFGVSAEDWEGMTLEEKRPSHEQWAQSFERYALEGKAPTTDMQPVFSRFRSWLLNVYKSVKEFLRQNPLAGKLNDDVRGIFDRLIASEEAIAEAEKVRSFAPLFADAETAGVTAKRYEEYLESGRQATADAITELNARSIRDMKWLSNARGRALKKLQAEARTKRKLLRAEVEREIAEEPIERAKLLLSKGQVLDLNGDIVDSPAAFKLSLAEVKELRPNVNLNAIRGMTSTDGVSLDLAAQLVGMRSGEELLTELIEGESTRSKVQARVDQRMLEENGDLVDDRAIEAAADEAVHNEARARFMATGLAMLTESKGDTRQLVKAAKQAALSVIAGKTVREIKPGQYSAAESRANKEALKLAAKDRAGAANAQRAALLNNKLYAVARDAKAEIDSIVKYVKKFENKNLGKSVDYEYLEQINDLLQAFDFQNKSLKDLDKSKSLLDWVQEQEANGFQPAIDVSLIEDLKRKNYKDMTLEELRMLRDTIKQIEHLGRYKHKLLTAKDKREFQERIDEADASIRENANRTVEEKATPTHVFGKVGQWFRQMTAAHRKFNSLMREMDGGRDNGAMWQLLSFGMNDAGNKETEMRQAAATKMAELFKMIKLEQGFANLTAKKRVVPGTNLSMTHEQRIMFGMNWGNEGNRQRLLDGGVTGRRAISLPEAQKVLDTLTKEEWDFIQATWDYIGTYKEQIGALERKMTGIEPTWIEASPVVTPHGTYRGGYFPAKYDTELSTRSESLEAVTDLRMGMKGAFQSSATRNGYTQERAKAVINRPLLLSFNVIPQHVNEVIHRLSWQPWLTDANRVLKALDSPIREHYGADILRELRNTVQDIAVGDAPAKNAMESAINRIRVGSTIVGMGWKLSTALLQPTGLAQSYVRVGPQWMTKGLLQFMSGPNDAATFADSKSSMMRNRGVTMQREINEVLNTLRAGETASAFQASYFVLIGKMQRAVDIPTWLGAYEKGLATVGYENAVDDTQREAMELQAVALADQAVLDSQSGGMTKDLAGIQRGSPLQKLFTNFYSYFSATYNLNVEAVRKTDFKSPTEVLVLANNLLLLNVVPVIFAVALKEATKGDCGDDIECLTAKLGQEQASFLLGQMVGLREISAGVGVALGAEQYGYQGPAGLRFFSDLYKIGIQARQGEFDMPFFKSVNNAAGAVLHYPAGQINATIEGIIAVEEGSVEGVSILPALIFGPPKD